MESRVQVDYITQENDGHKVMVFAPAHEFEHERPVWAEIDDMLIDLEPEEVGLSSYHVHVEISKSGYSDGGYVLSPWPFD